jgi:hypothetical protein
MSNVHMRSGKARITDESQIRRAVMGLLLVLALVGIATAAWADTTLDRLAIPGPINFDAASYQLSWSAHPAADYYKQEYLPAGETSEHFSRMVLIEAITHGANVDGVVSARVKMLNQRKATDPTVNYAVLKNPANGEVILDFILSATTDKGEMVVEWNAYRYIAMKGGDGVVLFGISRRAYGDATGDFLRGLKSTRPAEIKALAAYVWPTPRPAK